jgi:hypothetical protein
MEQDQALEILLSGRSVFLTGGPGTGKSYVIREFMKRSRRVALTASTGIAATNIGGQTIHSWSGIGARRELTSTDVFVIRNGPAGRRIRSADTLVIDEVSMLSGDTLQMLDYVCREARGVIHRGDLNKPFGGLQVVLVGDFFQLPPVVVKKEDVRWHFAFEAPCWGELDPRVCYLTKVHRQDEPEFLSLLASIRAGRCDPGDYRLHDRFFDHRDDVPVGVPHLDTHNKDVNALNAVRLASLPGPSATFRMTSEGEPNHVSALMRGCQSPETLTLKDGATVIFTRNDQEGRFVNGTTGVVVDARGADGWPVVQLKGSDGKPGAKVTAEPVSWEMVEQTDEQALDTAALPQVKPIGSALALPEARTEKRVLARISQVPLRLAWGITVHKSQGMSLDAAVMDLSRTFEYGQGYVALSRVRSLGGLHLLGWNYRALQVHPLVLRKDAEFRAASDALDNAYDRAELRRPGYPTLSSAVERV